MTPAAVGPSWRCALCGGHRRRVCLRHPDGALVGCRACGLVAVDPLPTRATALAQYDATYFRGEHGYRDYAAEEAPFRAVFRRRLARLVGHGARGRLLDVGAATGAFLVEAAAAGFAVAGLEPADAVATQARARGLDVRTGAIEDVALAPAAHDVVTAFDVVEHLVDPVAALAALARTTRPGGLVAVTVPDFGGWWARLAGARWPFVTPREHLHYFTRRTLRAALAAAGLDVVEVSLASTPLSLGTALRKGLGRWGRALERRLGRRADRGGALPFGTLLAIARRPGATGAVGRGP